MTHDVVVVGGGPGGLATALTLQRDGWNVVVIEQQVAGAARAGSGLTLWPNGVNALRRLGLATVLDGARMLDGMTMAAPDGRRLQHTDASTLRRTCGAPAYGLSRSELQSRLRDALPADSLVEGRVTEVVERADRVVCVTATGELAARLVVAADGAHSVVRAQLWGRSEPRRLGMTVWRGVAPVDLGQHAGEVRMGRGRQFGIFPINGGTYWFAAAPSRLPAERWWSAFAAWADPVPELIARTAATDMVVHDVYDFRPLAAPWGRGRVTLLGDAAHLAAPTMGQGTAYAFEDAVALRQALAIDPGPAGLRCYEVARERRSRALVASSHLAARAGIVRSRWVCATRDLALRATPRPVRLHQLRAMFVT